MIKQHFDHLDFLIGELLEVSLFWEVLADQLVGVLDGASLPGGDKSSGTEITRQRRRPWSRRRMSSRPCAVALRQRSCHTANETIEIRRAFDFMSGQHRSQAGLKITTDELRTKVIQMMSRRQAGHVEDGRRHMPL
jgi:hypothetical protein